MHLWRIRLINKKGEINLDDPSWIVATFGGDTLIEITRQMEEAKESVMISNLGPPSIHLKHEEQEFDIEIVEFDALGVARF